MSPEHVDEQEQRLRVLLAEAVQRFDEGGQPALDAFLARHEAEAPALQHRLQLLLGVGMLAPAIGEPEAGVPERLGEFRLHRRLGGGGMGVVYLAAQPSLQRDVALKLIRPEQLYFPQARARFRREIEAVARLQHPGIVRVYAAGEEAGLPYFTMEVVQGVSLDRLLQALRSLPLSRLDETHLQAALIALGGDPQVVRGAAASNRSWVEICCAWMRDLAEALAYAHGLGVLHRDVKPANVMVTWTGRVVLLDFGLASTREGDRITRTGSQLGSLPYMAPEQVRGDRAGVDARTDVYALGVTMYESLTLHSPFHDAGSSDEEVRRRIVQTTPVSLRQHNPAVSRDAETVCLCAMAPERAQRYQSAGDFVKDLANVLGLRPLAAQRPSPTARLRRFVRRRPAVATALGMGFLLVVVAPTVVAVREYWLRAEITTAKDIAEFENETREETLRFLNEDLLAAVAPDELGRDVSMRAVLDVAGKRIEGRFPGRPSVEAAIRRTLGHTYTLLGAYAEAEPQLQRAVALFSEHNGASHPMTLKSRRSLASLYSRQERFTEAATLGALVVRATEAALGPSHEDTLIAKNDHALVLIRMARFDEAEPMLRAVVDQRRRLLGDEHPHTLVSMSSLGTLYADSDRPALAEPWLRLNLEGCRRTFGADHPHLLVAINSWANLQSALGNMEDSRGLRQDLCERSERVFGRDHELTIARLSEFGYCQSLLGDHAGAETTIQDALDRCTRLAPDHPLVSRVRMALNAAQMSAGRAEAALVTIDAALAGMRASVDPRPIQIQDGEMLRASTLFKLRRWTEAEQSSASTIAALEAAGVSDTNLAQAKMLQGRCLLELGRHTDAERVLLEAEAAWRAHSPRHIYAGQTHGSLIRLYKAWQRPDDAAVWTQRLAEWRQSQDQRHASR